MKKVWFILEENYHRGPFTFEELTLMHEHKKIKDNEIIWREGLPSAVTFKEIHQLELLKLEESIPLIPDDAKLPTLNSLMETPRLPGKPSTHPPVIPPEIKQTVAKTKSVLEDEGSANKMVLPEIKKTSGSKIFKLYFASLGLIVFLVFGFIFYQYSFKEPKLHEPLSMLSTDHERLSEVIKARKEKNFLYELAVSKNFDIIWVATNYPYPAKVRLEFSSYPKKTSKNLEVKGYSEGTLDHFLASFEHLTFSSGDRLVQGVYHFKLSLKEEYPTSLIQRMAYKSREFPTVEFDSYLGFGNEEQFLKHIAAPVEELRPKEEAESAELVALLEKEEKLRTLQTLVTMTETKTTELIKEIKDKKLLSKKKELEKAIGDYEHAYVQEVSPLLSSLGQEANLDLSRSFGSHFMKTLAEFRKFNKSKKPDSKKFESFGQESLLKFKEISVNLESDIKAVETQVSDMKAQVKK